MKRDKLPDFIIGGAMKSGTSTLHYILNQHDGIFIPDREIYFFDIDDIRQHSDFFARSKSNGWQCPDYEENFEKYRKWYESFFEPARDDQIVGEDSTTYLSSELAPERIFEMLPGVKLIFMLRNPVDRAYSHYWHLVRTGRAIYDFERSLQYMRETIIDRGLYREQAQRFLDVFPEKNIKFVIFEEFINNIQDGIDEITDFIGLNQRIDVGSIDTHKNQGRYPISLFLQLRFNSMFRDYVARRYEDHIPESKLSPPPKIYSLVKKIFLKLNFALCKSQPPMAKDTRHFLENFYSRKNQGLERLIGKDVKKRWGISNVNS